MHTIVPDASARPYVLIGLNYMWQPVSEHRFKTLEDLVKAAADAAPAVESNRRSWFPLERQAVRQKAIGPRGKVLALDELVAWGRRLSREQCLFWRAKKFEFRRGSVPGVRTWRGGSSTRPHRVQAERRDNALVLWEDGEVPARAVRRGGYLPDDWDNRRRIIQKSWKSQRRGRKSWDRPAPHGKAREG
jgi:hypothetical protein